MSETVETTGPEDGTGTGVTKETGNESLRTSADAVDQGEIVQAGVDVRTAEAAAAAGVVAAGSVQDAVAELAAATAAGSALADTTLTGTTVDGGGDTERVVVADLYAFFGTVRGQEFHLTARKGDVVKLTAEEAARGEAAGALAAQQQVEQADAADEGDQGGDEPTIAKRRRR